MGPNWYSGKDKSMMLSNILFRTGGCSMLLTNNRALKHKALLELTCSVRTHIGSDDEAYRSCIQVEDDLGHKGFRLTRDLPKAGAKALTMNLRVLLPKVLPLSELLRYQITYYRNKVMGRSIPKGAGPGNPFSEKFDWINDASLDLATREDYLPLLSKYSIG
ncbi:hypothetical protein OIU78_026983 [Salix suchowensis]|nr:hypothetical protein OIU78_026983 [Salix suchowensis]